MGNETGKGLETGTYRSWLPSGCVKLGFIFGDAVLRSVDGVLYFLKSGEGVAETTLRQKGTLHKSEPLRRQ